MGKIIKKKDNRLLLGVTGGVASGKSTVAHMLEQLGAHIIDSDVIARQVVEPGKPAWKQVVDYFGKQILQKNGNIDRKKLSKIVFRDFEKRKKLEGFTHPLIYDAYVKQANEIMEKDPEAIIQVVVPLLIELRLQYMFHKIVVVYIPQELQVERLAERDGISKEEAANMLKAQLPIEEKLEYADFVIHNEGSLEETKKYVDDLWQSLKRLQITGILHN